MEARLSPGWCVVVVVCPGSGSVQCGGCAVPVVVCKMRRYTHDTVSHYFQQPELPTQGKSNNNNLTSLPSSLSRYSYLKSNLPTCLHTCTYAFPAVVSSCRKAHCTTASPTSCMTIACSRVKSGGANEGNERANERVIGRPALINRQSTW